MSKGYDLYCPRCGCLMVRRKGKYGEFYGCTGYPKCFNTFNMRDAQLELENQVGVHEGEDTQDFYGSGGDYDPGGTYD